MRNRLLAVVVVAAGVMAVSVPLLAHHGNAAYATATQITLKGTVTEWFWANPHCFLKFDVKDETGKIVNWAAEVSNPPDMVRAGWTKTSFKAGDEITVVLIVAKNDLPVGRIRQVTLADGQVYRTGGGQQPPPAATP
ncbi:MAG: DUF6152 family protein [Vicinamibacterales bacterium]